MDDDEKFASKAGLPAGDFRFRGSKTVVRGPRALMIPGSFARRQSLILIFVPRIQ